MKFTTKHMLALILGVSSLWQGLSANNLVVDENINWDALPEAVDIHEILRMKPNTPIFLANRSSIAMIANYIYAGREVTQLIPAGQSVPLGVFGKINFRAGFEPRVYRYNDFGAKIFGQAYKMPFNITYNDFVKGKQYGNAVINNPVLEISFTVSSFFNSGFDARLLLRPGYNLTARENAVIFPNYSPNFLRSCVGMAPALTTAAEDAYNAKRLLNLPDLFAQEITVAQAINRVEAATEALSDAAMSGRWIAPQHENAVLRAINTAGATLIDFIRKHGDTINVVEWAA
jgi:hypothetical protein